MFQRLRQFYLVSSKMQGGQKVLVIIAVTIVFSITAAFFFWQDALIKELRYVENSVHLNDMLSFGEQRVQIHRHLSALECCALLKSSELGGRCPKKRGRGRCIYFLCFSQI